jgi:hypothetical protein
MTGGNQRDHSHAAPGGTLALNPALFAYGSAELSGITIAKCVRWPVYIEGSQK